MPDKNSNSDPWVTRMTLLQRARDPNDSLAWDEFVGYYQGFLLAVLRRMRVSVNDQDDLIQNVLIKIWKAFPNYEYDDQQAKFRTWLGRVVRNAVIDLVRSEKKHLKSKGNDELLAECEDPKSSHELEGVIQKEWQQHIIRLAFDSIRSKFSDRAITALELTLQGKSIEEISEALEMKENSAYKLRNRAKKHLMLEVERLRKELEHG
jgi:RNA polymerase sigma-70 factor (ECF subfamily)